MKKKINLKKKQIREKKKEENFTSLLVDASLLISGKFIVSLTS
jgi:hypothetical protein